jgi:DNA-binding NarL/FixJ family response regulator
MIFTLVQLALLAVTAAAMYAQVRITRVRDAHVDQVLAELRAAAQAAQTAPEPVPFSGMNLNKRTQAVRLLRRGEDVGHVAAALGIPRGEVELLVRVHEMSAKQMSIKREQPAPGTPLEKSPGPLLQ